MIIQRGIRVNTSPGILMLQHAMQLSLVSYPTLNHRAIMLRLSPARVKPRLLIFAPEFHLFSEKKRFQHAVIGAQRNITCS